MKLKKYIITNDIKVIEDAIFEGNVMDIISRNLNEKSLREILDFCGIDKNNKDWFYLYTKDLSIEVNRYGLENSKSLSKILNEKAYFGIHSLQMYDGYGIFSLVLE